MLTHQKTNTHYCYILRNHHEPHIKRTYNGYTIDPKKRLRQHNQEIKGGAIYTKTWGEKSWEICAIIKGFPDHRTALQCEWRIKHPAPKRIRPAKYNSPMGRIIGLFETLSMDRFTSKTMYLTSDLTLEVWILSEYASCIKELKSNITVHLIDKIDLSLI